MEICLRPSLATLSQNKASHRYSGLLANSWPVEPGSYELTREIGTGSSASVHQALCKDLQATVAVKKINLDGTDLALLTREAALLRRFQHHGVLLLYTSFVVGRELWMVMPLMDLGSVRSIMRRACPQGLRDEVLIATIMKSTLQALDYVHKCGGIHRDVKADNILINSNGEVRLADFGVATDNSNAMSIILDRVFAGNAADSTTTTTTSSSSSSGSGSYNGRQARQVEDSKDASLPGALLGLRANTFVGTPCWMAPEVMQQLDEGYTNAADIWSVGITMIELATGRPPLARCHPMRVLVDTLNGPPPGLPEKGGFSKGFRDLVAACLQKDPRKRLSAGELLQHRFFKSAKDAAYLSATLKAALLVAQQPGAASAATARAASIPGASNLARSGLSASMHAGNSRKVQSEPLMSRLRSVLGLSSGLARVERGSFLSRQTSRFRAASQSGGTCVRQKSKWQFTAAAMGLKLQPTSGAAAEDDAAELVGSDPATAAASLSRTASTAGALSRHGSRGLQVHLAGPGLAGPFGTKN